MRYDTDYLPYLPGANPQTKCQGPKMAVYLILRSVTEQCRSPGFGRRATSRLQPVEELERSARTGGGDVL